MNSNLKQYQQRIIDYVMSLRDPRQAGQAIFVGLILLMTWSGIKTIQTNYELQKQISAQRQRNQVLQLQNANQRLQNEYFNSREYLDLTARRNLGLGAPGEKVLLVSKQVALANAPALPANATQKTTETNQQSNVRAWIDFFLHR